MRRIVILSINLGAFRGCLQRKCLHLESIVIVEGLRPVASLRRRTHVRIESHWTYLPFLFKISPPAHHLLGHGLVATSVGIGPIEVLISGDGPRPAPILLILIAAKADVLETGAAEQRLTERADVRCCLPRVGHAPRAFPLGLVDGLPDGVRVHPHIERVSQTGPALFFNRIIDPSSFADIG